MSNVRIDDKLPQFNRRLDTLIDTAFRHLANDIVTVARPVTPYSGTKKTRASAGKSGRGGAGHLRSAILPKRLAKHKWRIEVNKEYAHRQEIGGYGWNYTTAGTGPHYLSKSGDKVMKNALQTIRQYARRA